MYSLVFFEDITPNRNMLCLLMCFAKCTQTLLIKHNAQLMCIWHIEVLI